MSNRKATNHARLMCGAAAAAIIASAGMAHAEDGKTINIAPQSLATALYEFGGQTGRQVLFTPDIAAAKTTRGVAGATDQQTALAQLLEGTGLTFRRTGDTFLIMRADSPQSAGAAGGGAEVEALIVTAQKREEDIQDVPIAISAFTQEALETHQIAGGPDLMTQIPNFTFTKTNFSSYSIQIRGIGTQAISATVDPAVAVAFNNTPFIRNRFFEQEFYDLNRVEVLRGPQGTLYGRNATAGVVNLLTARPKLSTFEARLSADVSNYNSTRLEGMVNLPLVEDRVALRLAGAWTKRDGYVTNEITGEQIDGRDLWSGRATLAFEPTEALRAYLTYEHFEEDDDRLRSGKQLCTRGENQVFGGGSGGVFGASTYTTQGCVMGSLYEADAFQVPNGFALPYWGPLVDVGMPINEDIDPYASTTQSRDLRVIASELQPVYQAKTDIVHLAVNYDLADALTFTSETGYSTDELFSFQDFNRFNTSPGVFDPNHDAAITRQMVRRQILSPEGVFCDPQLGCSDRLVAADVSTARSSQFSQEFRISSAFDGPFNFHLGANYLRYDTEDKYYVFVNSLTMLTTFNGTPNDTPLLWEPGVSDNSHCLFNFQTVDPNDPKLDGCWYIDPNPIGSLNDNGRNYFLSKNPFRLISYAVFGEAVYNITPALKVTAGLRYTVDKKHAPLAPSWLLTGGYGTPVKEMNEQEWREPTGRLVIDWKPALDFTDETLLYASYAHGYKAGGTNPPLPGSLPLADIYQGDEVSDQIELNQPPEFGPEFIDAFEIGAKNTLLDGRMTLNASAFYYDYEGYQISQIVNRSAVNLNFDAEVWGAELELDWRPVENLKLGFKGGWQKSRIGEGQGAIDMIDRTAGRDDWIVIKPFPTNPSNCILPRWLVETYSWAQFFSSGGGACNFAYLLGHDPVTNLPYVPNPDVRDDMAQLQGYPGFDPSTAPNNGQGFTKDVGGNELPNAPDFTTTFTIDYTIPLPSEWLMTLHADLYRQSEAWTRIFNEDPYDKLKPFTNVNVAAIFTNEDAGWKVMAYVKNVFDKDNITGAFLNSDDTALTTNVFLTEPRLYGLRVTKTWTGQPWWNVGADAGALPLSVEVGGMAQRHEVPNALATPGFAETFSDAIRPVFAASQGEDLDWGDGREVTVTYAPRTSPWRFSLAGRFGRTNGVSHVENVEKPAGSWITFIDTPVFPGICSDQPGDIQCYVPHPGNYAQARTRDLEEHALVDFQVGRELGLGFATSTLSAGLRYAAFNAVSDIELRGTPDYTFPPELLLFPTNRVSLTRYDARFDVDRDFEGFGPVVEWDASRALLGNEDTGVVDLDVALSGGVLFGKQQASVTQESSASHYSFNWGVNGPTVSSQRGAPVAALSYDNPPVTVTRSDRVQAPFAGAELGLSYRAGRVKVGAGYRWERYFDVLDGGMDEAESVDRTIDGPYFKLAVGFGG